AVGRASPALVLDVPDVGCAVISLEHVEQHVPAAGRVDRSNVAAPVTRPVDAVSFPAVADLPLVLWGDRSELALPLRSRKSRRDEGLVKLLDLLPREQCDAREHDNDDT